MSRNVLEIEVDGPRNEHLLFRPLQRRIRGRMDFKRVANPHSLVKAAEWPDGGIPGQRLGIDLATGAAYIADGIHDNLAVKDRITKLGREIPPEREDLGKVHLPSWLFYLTRAVQSGVAKITKGSLPETIDGEPVKSFVVNRQQPSTTARLTDVLAELTGLLKGRKN